MKKWAFVLVAAAGIGAACGKPTTPAPAFTVEAAPVAAKTGEKTQALLRFVPREGLHWNDEFPAKAKLDATAGLEAEIAGLRERLRQRKKCKMNPSFRHVHRSSILPGGRCLKILRRGVIAHWPRK